LSKVEQPVTAVTASKPNRLKEWRKRIMTHLSLLLHLEARISARDQFFAHGIMRHDKGMSKRLEKFAA
jgi:hypothetical protein